MFHDSTWLRRTRAVPRRRRASSLGLLGFLLVCALLATLPAAAFASAPEMRGEWELVLEVPGQTLKGKTTITQEADGSGKFESGQVQYEMGFTGIFSGTLKGSEAEVTVTLSYGPGKFEGEKMTVTSGPSTLSISGSGTMTLGSNKTTGNVTATRLRSQKQIEEQEAKEKLEKEEREARANVRGEWALTLEDGPVVVKEIALISEEASAKNEFAAKSVLLEGKPAGTFTGTLKGAETEITLTTNEVPGQLPPGTFFSKTIAVSSKTNPTSMTGSGELSFEGGEPPASTATLTATRIRSYQQIQEQEAKEREAIEREAKEQEEREKRAEEAQIAKEKAELLAKETAERETKERREREGREAVEKADKIIVPPPVGTPNPSLVSVALATKTLKGVTVGHSRTVTLELSNPNHLAVAGQLDMFTAVSGGSASTKKKITQFGTASFTVASGGATSVKLKLSSANYATLLKRKRLRAVVNVTTTADGVSTPTKSYGVTLSLAPTTVHKR